MYPHVRLVLAAMAFSGALGLLIALFGYAVVLWFMSVPPGEPIDDEPIRGAGTIIVMLAPALALYSLALSIPVSYLQWSRPRFHSAAIALGCLVVAMCICGYFFYPRATVPVTAMAVVVLAALLALASIAWRVAMPVSNNHGTDA